MPTTDNGLWYPVLGAANNPPTDFQTLGETIDGRYGLAVATYSDLAAIGTPYPGMRVWVTDLLGHAIWDGTAWRQPDLYFEKDTDQTLTSNTTLQDDADLVANIETTGTFIGKLVLFGSSSVDAGGDIKLGFDHPGGTLDLGGVAPDSGLASGTVQTAQFGAFLAQGSPTSLLVYGLSTSRNTLVVRFRYTATATGDLQLRWAQNTASGSTTLRAGSHLTLKQVAA